MKDNAETKKKEESEHVHEEQATEPSLADFAMAQGLKVFRDQYEEPYCLLPDETRGCVRIGSKDFRQWLTYTTLKAWGRPASHEAIRGAVRVLQSRSLYEADQHSLDVRIVSQNGALWYDLCNGRAVRITKEGWEVTSDVPVLFLTVRHQLPQVEPVKGGDIRELLKFVNVPGGASVESATPLLLLAWIITAFIPTFPQPVLILHGPQGSAKTSTFKLLRKLLDPSLTETISFPDSVTEFAQIAAHNYFVAFDNISTLSKGFSDVLCRACTGDGFTKRKLFTDDEDIVFTYRRTIALNGINIAATKADLLDRSLLIGLERVSYFGREQGYWPRFEEARPRILGGIFDVLVEVLQNVGSVPETGSFRMADFAQYGCAVAGALGLNPVQFTKAYRDNIAKQDYEALSSTLLGTVLVRFARRVGKFEDTPTRLLQELNAEATSVTLNARDHFWPKTEGWMMRRINEIKINLQNVGIAVERDDKVVRVIDVAGEENVPDVPNDVDF